MLSGLCLRLKICIGRHRRRAHSRFADVICLALRPTNIRIPPSVLLRFANQPLVCLVRAPLLRFLLDLAHRGANLAVASLAERPIRRARVRTVRRIRRCRGHLGEHRALDLGHLNRDSGPCPLTLQHLRPRGARGLVRACSRRDSDGRGRVRAAGSRGPGQGPLLEGHRRVGAGLRRRAVAVVARGGCNDAPHGRVALVHLHLRLLAVVPHDGPGGAALGLDRPKARVLVLKVVADPGPLVQRAVRARHARSVGAARNLDRAGENRPARIGRFRGAVRGVGLLIEVVLVLVFLRRLLALRLLRVPVLLGPPRPLLPPGRLPRESPAPLELVIARVAQDHADQILPVLPRSLRVLVHPVEPAALLRVPALQVRAALPRLLWPRGLARRPLLRPLSAPPLVGPPAPPIALQRALALELIVTTVAQHLAHEGAPVLAARARPGENFIVLPGAGRVGAPLVRAAVHRTWLSTIELHHPLEARASPRPVRRRCAWLAGASARGGELLGGGGVGRPAPGMLCPLLEGEERRISLAPALSCTSRAPRTQPV
mmetsp:Transcript_56072/g.137540  ORF Transcript_56072/g.137540 Transcript_56072/m.137540 type:complete len:544 (+) Transcript_56072:1263-2894(+)